MHFSNRSPPPHAKPNPVAELQPDSPQPLYRLDVRSMHAPQPVILRVRPHEAPDSVRGLRGPTNNTTGHHSSGGGALDRSGLAAEHHRASTSHPLRISPPLESPSFQQMAAIDPRAAVSTLLQTIREGSSSFSSQDRSGTGAAARRRSPVSSSPPPRSTGGAARRSTSPQAWSPTHTAASDTPKLRYYAPGPTSSRGVERERLSYVSSSFASVGGMMSTTTTTTAVKASATAAARRRRSASEEGREQRMAALEAQLRALTAGAAAAAAATGSSSRSGIARSNSNAREPLQPQPQPSHFLSTPAMQGRAGGVLGMQTATAATAASMSTATQSVAAQPLRDARVVPSHGPLFPPSATKSAQLSGSVTGVPDVDPESGGMPSPWSALGGGVDVSSTHLDLANASTDDVASAEDYSRQRLGEIALAAISGMQQLERTVSHGMAPTHIYTAEECAFGRLQRQFRAELATALSAHQRFEFERRAALLKRLVKTVAAFESDEASLREGIVGGEQFWRGELRTAMAVAGMALRETHDMYTRRRQAQQHAAADALLTSELHGREVTVLDELRDRAALLRLEENAAKWRLVNARAQHLATMEERHGRRLVADAELAALAVLELQAAHLRDVVMRQRLNERYMPPSSATPLLSSPHAAERSKPQSPPQQQQQQSTPEKYVNGDASPTRQVTVPVAAAYGDSSIERKLSNSSFSLPTQSSVRRSSAGRTAVEHSPKSKLVSPPRAAQLVDTSGAASGGKSSARRERSSGRSSGTPSAAASRASPPRTPGAQPPPRSAAVSDDTTSNVLEVTAIEASTRFNESLSASAEKRWANGGGTQTRRSAEVVSNARTAAAATDRPSGHEEGGMANASHGLHYQQDEAHYETDDDDENGDADAARQRPEAAEEEEMERLPTRPPLHSHARNLSRSHMDDREDLDAPLQQQQQVSNPRPRRAAADVALLSRPTASSTGKARQVHAGAPPLALAHGSARSSTTTSNTMLHSPKRSRHGGATSLDRAGSGSRPFSAQRSPASTPLLSRKPSTLFNATSSSQLKKIFSEQPQPTPTPAPSTHSKTNTSYSRTGVGIMGVATAGRSTSANASTSNVVGRSGSQRSSYIDAFYRQSDEVREEIFSRALGSKNRRKSPIRDIPPPNHPNFLLEGQQQDDPSFVVLVDSSSDDGDDGRERRPQRRNANARRKRSAQATTPQQSPVTAALLTSPRRRKQRDDQPSSGGRHVGAGTRSTLWKHQTPPLSPVQTHLQPSHQFDQSTDSVPQQQQPVGSAGSPSAWERHMLGNVYKSAGTRSRPR